MKTWVRYGRGRLDFSVPDGARVIQCPEVAPLADPLARITEALERPIGAQPLGELARKLAPGAKVVVVISDITRPVPNQLLLEPLLGRFPIAAMPVSRKGGRGGDALRNVVGRRVHGGSCWWLYDSTVRRLSRPVASARRWGESQWQLKTSPL